jgi:hypothetical protein
MKKVLVFILLGVMLLSGFSMVAGNRDAKVYGPEEYKGQPLHNFNPQPEEYNGQEIILYKLNPQEYHGQPLHDFNK